MPPEDPFNGSPPPFLYGSHYSTPGFVLHYLVRAAPQHMLSLQNGKFDAPDRLFASVPNAWQSASVKNPSDVKELIPEFYSGDGSFLRNASDLPLGTTQDGVALGDVALPPWAKSPRDFVKKCRKALDSEHVSQHLHLWIDLIFGSKQRGPEAVKHQNLFYYLTYEGAVDLEAVADPSKRAAYESQINEFGQCPKQLFCSAHPSRDAPPAALDALILAPDLEEASTAPSRGRNASAQNAAAASAAAGASASAASVSAASVSAAAAAAVAAKKNALVP
jgi:factor associated with neutral sphingomyelinase activation